MTFKEYKIKSGKSFSRISEETSIPRTTLWRIAHGGECPKLIDALVLRDWSKGEITLSDLTSSPEVTA